MQEDEFGRDDLRCHATMEKIALLEAKISESANDEEESAVEIPVLGSSSKSRDESVSSAIKDLRETVNNSCRYYS
jgi:hypothetical protein